MVGAFYPLDDLAAGSGEDLSSRDDLVDEANALADPFRPATT